MARVTEGQTTGDIASQALKIDIGKVDRLCGDILSDCSREVYEANMNDLTKDLEDLGTFLEHHQEKIKLLASVLNEPA